MKKSLFFAAAASALMLTACSSENDVVQSSTKNTVAVQQQAVGFDVYTQQSTGVTRAGLEGTMTTTRMQRSAADGGGFGVYAYLTEDDNADPGTGDATPEATGYTSDAGQDPDFMWNEKILWNNTNLGWYYNPLKYWPNETDKDSQSSAATMEGADDHLDRLTFFAYAPYVAAGAGSTGITAISDANGKLSSTDVDDPTIAWTATSSVENWNPNEGVDLLWGVAPSGGLSYTAVNGWTVTRKEGTPLIDMIKPDVNTSMKFLFQHALARFGINVVAAIDQVSPGGELDPNTKITINSLKITGPFGTGGELNLNNGVNANIANWTKITGGTADEPVTGLTTTLSADKTITVTGKIAQNLKYDGPHTFGSYSPQNIVGVTPAKQDLLAPSTNWYNKLAGVPAYSPAKKYYSSDAGAAAPTAQYVYTKATEKNGVWGFLYQYNTVTGEFTKQGSTLDAPDFPTYPGTTPVLYFVKATEYTAASAGVAPKDALSNDIPAGAIVYTSNDKDGTTEANAVEYTKNDSYSAPTPDWSGIAAGAKVYTLEPLAVASPSEIFTYPAGEYYEAERNYLYVVPTNNVAKNAGAAVDDLRTITVQIEYYITTEDAKIQGGRTQTKNVITKQVVLPSLANGKSYMLNLILGLTSVKIEAEVDDWKVVNVNTDLPQNTSN